MNEITKISHGIHRYAWENWTTHLKQQAQLRHKAAVSIGDETMNQLQSLFWLHKTQPSMSPVTMHSLHLSAHAFQGMPDVAVLLSKIFKFQDSIPSIEQENCDPGGKSSYSTMEHLHFVSWTFTSSAFTSPTTDPCL